MTSYDIFLLTALSCAHCNGMFCMQWSLQPSIVSLSWHLPIPTAEHPTLFCIPQISQVAISNVPLCSLWVITNSVHVYFGLPVSQVVPKLARPTDKNKVNSKTTAWPKCIRLTHKQAVILHAALLLPSMSELLHPLFYYYRPSMAGLLVLQSDSTGDEMTDRPTEPSAPATVDILLQRLYPVV